MSTADRIISLIKEKGFTQTFVCEKLGMSRCKIGDWARGKSTPKPIEIAKLSKLLGVSEDYLCGRTDMKTASVGIENSAPVKNMSAIPIVGVIHAGKPAIASENNEGYEFSDVADPENYFYLRVNGDSMINANITDGSLVLIRKQGFAENGQIVACIVDGESATLKRFKSSGNMIALIPENSAYEPILLTDKEFENGTAVILGVAVEVKIKL